MGDLDPAQGNDQASARGRQVRPRHAGGLDNPLGARTLHLYQNGAYTLYTIYASSDPETIGSGITSGCVGLLSQDMIHLYARTPVKTKVVVLPA